MRVWPLRKRTNPDVPDTNVSIWPSIERFWDTMKGLGFSPALIAKVWVANRCIQLNSQQVASMPLRFHGTSEPAWVTNPDPVWYPNGIGDAVFAAIWSMYGWGDAFLYITARYVTGFPSAWTVLDPNRVGVRVQQGVRTYYLDNKPLNRNDVVQVTRNPRGKVRGTSALRAYAPYLYGSIATAEVGAAIQTGVPNAVLKSQRKLNAKQAKDLQDAWVQATAVRRGAPAVLPPEIDFTQLAFSPRDLLLLDAQEFNARVIASAFGVPSMLLNMPLEGGLTYQNPEILFDYWWRAELRPCAKRLSDAMSAQMLPRANSVEFDARDTLAPSLKELHDIWHEAAVDGLVTGDEYRQAVLQLGPKGTAGTLDELLRPATAGASPADQPGPVVPLRPTQIVSEVVG